MIGEVKKLKDYVEINAHHIGNMHIQKNLPCEDFSMSYADENMAVAVISDGHGDKNCFRSGEGARIACETSVSLCQKFYMTSESMMNEYGISALGQVLTGLEAEIVHTWKKNVMQDYTDKPFTEEEIQTASEKMQEIYRSGKKIEKAYGCTLILAVVTKKYWFGLQIGDGKCVAAYDDGVFVEPVPKNEKCVANYSTSLCGENAELDFMHYYSEAVPRGVFVFSDGVEESFDRSGLYNCLYSIDMWLERGREATLESINDLLPKISEGGSGDDVSIAAVLSKEKTLLPPKKTPEQVEDLVNAYAANLEKCDEELDSAYNELDRLNEELKSAKEKTKQLEEEIARKQADIETYEEAQNKAFANMEKARKYQISAERFWESKLKQLGLTEEE